jgi:hypothetical protein
MQGPTCHFKFIKAKAKQSQGFQAKLGQAYHYFWGRSVWFWWCFYRFNFILVSNPSVFGDWAWELLPIIKMMGSVDHQNVWCIWTVQPPMVTSHDLVTSNSPHKHASTFGRTAKIQFAITLVLLSLNLGGKLLLLCMYSLENVLWMILLALISLKSNIDRMFQTSHY